MFLSSVDDRCTSKSFLSLDTLVDSFTLTVPLTLSAFSIPKSNS